MPEPHGQGSFLPIFLVIILLGSGILLFSVSLLLSLTNLILNNVGKISDFSVQNNSLKINQEVSHERFGYGIIIGIDGKGKDKIASIDFKGIGVKKLLLRFAKLKTI